MRAAVGAEFGAVAGAVAGFFAGSAVGRAIGLPHYRLFDDPEGIDDLTTALIGLLVAWLFGAWLGSRLATRRQEQPVRRLQVVALACMTLAAVGARFVGSATADWYYPLVFFAVPPVAMATAAAVRVSAQ